MLTLNCFVKEKKKRFGDCSANEKIVLMNVLFLQEYGNIGVD